MRRKKTHEEYVTEVNKVNPDIEVVDKYIDMNTKILHRCKIDGYEWTAYPSHILRNSRCPMCSGFKKRTQEEYVVEVARLNPDIEVVGVYVNNRTKILHRCKIDGYEWYTTPSSVLQGHGCPLCGGSMKLTHEQYVNRVRSTKPLIEVVGQYINHCTPILHRCLVDGYEWFVSPNNILSGRGCPICGGTMLKTHERYVEELKLKNPSVIAVGRYVNHTTKITHKCLIHNYEWDITPAHALEGCMCPICKAEKARYRLARTHDEYIKELATVNQSVLVLGQYVNAKTLIAHKCLICGWEWNVSPESLLVGHGCPQCNKCSKSVGEKKIVDWLDNHKISYQKQKTFDECRDKYVLRFDFYLPDYNILIEYNGKQHYQPIEYFGGAEGFNSIVKRDKIKERYCKENHISLMVIPYFADIYDELNNLYNLIKIYNNESEVAI